MSKLAPQLEVIRQSLGGERPDLELWWRDPEAKQWRTLAKLFSHLRFGPPSRDWIWAHIWDCDQMLDEWSVCQRCRAKEKYAEYGGYRDCWLEYEPGAGIERGSRNHYLDLKEHKEEGRVIWEFVKRRCRDWDQRQHEIAQRLGRYRNLGGGLRGVEVEQK